MSQTYTISVGDTDVLTDEHGATGRTYHIRVTNGEVTFTLAKRYGGDGAIAEAGDRVTYSVPPGERLYGEATGSNPPDVRVTPMGYNALDAGDDPVINFAPRLEQKITGGVNVTELSNQPNLHSDSITAAGGGTSFAAQNVPDNMQVLYRNDPGNSGDVTVNGDTTLEPGDTISLNVTDVSTPTFTGSGSETVTAIVEVS